MAKSVQIPPYPLGVYPEGNGIRVSFVAEASDCGIILFDKKTGDELRRISADQWNRLGHIRCGLIEDVDSKAVAYQFYAGEKCFPDAYGKVFVGQERYGEIRRAEEMKAGLSEGKFDWADDERPGLSYEESVGYCMHVRGFTMHGSSGVRHKGTFRGIIEKLDYLENLGITTVELQPVYEFREMEEAEQTGSVILNYWGYREGYYYAPKAAYAASMDPVKEFKEMVKAFHERQMEVILQFYFPREVPRQEIIDILRFWVMEYHVDGFRLMGDQLPLQLIAADHALADTKLWCDYVDGEAWFGGKKEVDKRELAVYRDDYMYDMRRFLKGDNDMLPTVCYQMRSNPATHGKINFFTNYYGLTMMDMVTYNDKHNEDNGEKNLDGTNYNQSWNCGVEGPCRKKQIVALRKKQYKNAMSMLFLSQGTPLIFMGDEFGNSQNGNNNPYCQDNETAWLNWKDLKRNRDLYEFTVKMIAFRRAHPVLRRNEEPKLVDYLAYGYPDLSYHGAEAWRPSMNSLDRQIAMMYCGRYAGIDKSKDDDYLYLAFNMNWEAGRFAMPRLPKGMRWELLFSTEKNGDGVSIKENGREASTEELIKTVSPRTVAIYIGREINNE